MVFSSTTFLFLFLPVVLALYFAMPRRGRNLVLIAAGFFFYAWGAGGFVFVSATGLLAAWWAYKRRFIQFRDFRAWLACHELLAERCDLEEGQFPHFEVKELGRFVGGVGGERLRGHATRSRGGAPEKNARRFSIARMPMAIRVSSARIIFDAAAASGSPIKVSMRSICATYCARICTNFGS